MLKTNVLQLIPTLLQRYATQARRHLLLALLLDDTQLLKALHKCAGIVEILGNREHAHPHAHSISIRHTTRTTTHTHTHNCACIQRPRRRATMAPQRRAEHPASKRTSIPSRSPMNSSPTNSCGYTTRLPLMPQYLCTAPTTKQAAGHQVRRSKWATRPGPTRHTCCARLCSPGGRN